MSRTAAGNLMRGAYYGLTGLRYYPFMKAAYDGYKAYTKKKSVPIYRTRYVSRRLRSNRYVRRYRAPYRRKIRRVKKKFKVRRRRYRRRTRRRR